MTKSLFVAGLDYSITSDDLKNIFIPYGTVISAAVISNKFTGQSKGFGFVDMSTQEEAEECILMLNNSMQKDRQIVVKFKLDDASTGRKPFNSGGDRFSQR